MPPLLLTADDNREEHQAQDEVSKQFFLHFCTPASFPGFPLLLLNITHMSYYNDVLTIPFALSLTVPFPKSRLVKEMHRTESLTPCPKQKTNTAAQHALLISFLRVYCMQVMTSRRQLASGDGYWSTQGSSMVDSAGKEVRGAYYG